MEPRPAATVVVARPGESGVEVLLLRRAQASRFAPGYVVFPGGVVDPGDTSLAAAWFGESGEAVRACAVRELAEEAGLVLTSAGLRPLADGEAIESAVGAAPPGLADLREMARWLAPEILPKRFDAWFFSVAAPGGARREAGHDRSLRGLVGAPGRRDGAPRAVGRRSCGRRTGRSRRSSRVRPFEQVLALRVEQGPPPPELLATYRSPGWLR
jgi:8-oxo-dGTP pyrophosphatase MutT (NUDIX family)